MNSQDLQNAIFAGNNIALEWYLVTHPQAHPPGVPAGTIAITPTSASLGSGIILLALGVVALLVLSKD